MARGLWLGIGLGGVVLAAGGCLGTDPSAFDPRLMQQMERTSASDIDEVALHPLPTTRVDAGTGLTRAEREGRIPPYARPSTGPDLDRDPIVRMSLQEIIHRAIANNHDVKVAGYQPAIEGTRVIEARANFDPVFFSNLSYEAKNDLTGGEIYNSFTGGGTVTSFINREEVGTAQVGLQQNLPSGGQITLQYEDTYNYFNPRQDQYNPFYESDLTLQLNQPLLKNAGLQVNEAQIRINRLNEKVSLLDFRKQVEQTASDIEKAYWSLVQTVSDIRIQEDLVHDTETTYNILATRMQRGLDVSQLQVSQAGTQLESRRATLLQFKAKARDYSDQLKQLMSDPEYPIISPVLILPADAPVLDPIEFDLQEQINTAMDNRFELGEDQLKVDAATVTVGVAKNNLEPELDFLGSVGPEGAGSNDGSALTRNFNFQHIDYTVGFKFQMPLGNRAARAIWKRALLQRMQAIESYKSQIEQVALDVKTAVRAVQTAYENIDQYRRSRFQAETAMNAIYQRERANEPLTPEFVQVKLQQQELLADAEESEAEAVADYNVAIANLERAKGTLLRYNNVLLEEQTPGATEKGLLR